MRFAWRARSRSFRTIYTAVRRRPFKMPPVAEIMIEIESSCPPFAPPTRPKSFDADFPGELGSRGHRQPRLGMEGKNGSAERMYRV